MPTSSILTTLKQSSIFSRFTATELELAAAVCHEQAFKSGETIFEENSKGTELYVIAPGSVDILIEGQSAPEEPRKDAVVATLKRGQSFGEIALVDDGLRSATARAAQSGTRLLVIPRDKLIMLCETYPQLGYRIMHNLAADLAAKIRNTDRRIREGLLYKPKA